MIIHPAYVYLAVLQADSVPPSPLAPQPVFTRPSNSVTVTSHNTLAKVSTASEPYCIIILLRSHPRTTPPLHSPAGFILHLCMSFHWFTFPGVSKAVANVNETIAPKLIASGLKVTQQKDIDDYLIQLDGTPNKGNLGANAILGVSIAVAEAGAGEKVRFEREPPSVLLLCYPLNIDGASPNTQDIPLYRHFADLAGVKPPFILPCPAFNVINGGSHADNRLAFQEFMLLPTGATSFSEAMKIGTETYHTLKKVIQKKYGLDGADYSSPSRLSTIRYFY
jgi:hypothetical protein